MTWAVPSGRSFADDDGREVPILMAHKALAALYASRASDDLRRARFTLETLLPDHEFFMKKSPEEMQKCIRDALNDLANAARADPGPMS